MTDPTKPPRLFISYSWGSQDHQNWVLSFANELVAAGVDVRLDKWHLRPGHDPNVFMETMVTDPKVTKVVLICDQAYAEKSNGRTGGAGTEAQIITPNIYAKHDQEKFVAVVRERDASGKPYLPTYYGSRLYIDLSNPADYAAEFEKVLRWAWDEPLHKPPAIGAKPSFLQPATSNPLIASANQQRRAIDAVKSGQSNSNAALSEYVEVIAKGMEVFRIECTPKNRPTFDDDIVASIDSFLEIRNEIIEVFFAVARYQPDEERANAVHRFFEQLIPYLFPPRGGGGFTEWDFDNYKFMVHELYLYWLGVLLQLERFELAAQSIETQFFWQSRMGGMGDMHAFTIFRQYMKSLEARNVRLKTSRISLRADLLKQRCAGLGVDFNAIMTADFILYFRACTGLATTFWYPETLLYSDRYGGAFEIFARSKSRRYFEKVKTLLGVSSQEELEAHAISIQLDPARAIKWQFDNLDVKKILGIDQIGQLP